MKKVALFTTALVMLAMPKVMAQMGDWGCPKVPRAHHQGFDRGRGHFGVLQCKAELALSDEQVDKIRQINFDHRQQMIDLKAEMEKLRLNKRHEMQSGVPDKTKMLTFTKEITALRGKIAESRVEHRFAIRDVLTKDQLEKWQDCRRRCVGRGRTGLRSPDTGFGPGQ